MFVNVEVTPLVGTSLPSNLPSSQPSSVTTPLTHQTFSIIDNTWFKPLTHLKHIITHGNVPEGTPGVKKYRPRKTLNTFLPNILYLLIWKYMCGQENLRWPAPRDLVYASQNFLTMKTMYNELRMNYNVEFGIIASYMNKSFMPTIDPTKLSDWIHNLKRKVKVGVWSTPEEYVLKPGGLYSGHLQIVSHLGFPLNTQDNE